ncbi:MAG: ATPase [Bacteroidales bacterium]|nr:ATPase [Bacteroidales bacterium]
MKNKLFGTLVVALMATLSLSAQSDKEKIFVAGECGMCKARIEKAAGTVEGVSEASWSAETKMLEFVFNAIGKDVKSVHKAVAAVGHDTRQVKAENDVYDKLPACCKYERIKEDDKKKEKGEKG